MTKRRFTLLEMLIVLSIISILLSMSVASGTSSDVAAQRVDCLNNKKQVIMAQFAYSLNNNNQLIFSVDGKIPYSVSLLGYSPDQGAKLMSAKMSDLELTGNMPDSTPILVLKSMVCPTYIAAKGKEDPDVLTKVDGMLNATTSASKNFFDTESLIKGTNKDQYFGMFFTEDKKTQTYQLGKIRYAPDLMMFADCFSSTVPFWYFQVDTTVTASEGSAGVSPRHNGKCTASYADGHAALADENELIDGPMKFDENKAIVRITDGKNQ